MRREHDRDALIVVQAADQARDLELIAQVERRGRFVEEEHATVGASVVGGARRLRPVAGTRCDLRERRRDDRRAAFRRR